MIILGYILFFLGCLAWLAGDLRFLVVAYRQGAAWFLGCLFLPFVPLAFLCLNLKQTWRPVTLSTAGYLVAGLGYWVGRFEFLENCL